MYRSRHVTWYFLNDFNVNFFGLQWFTIKVYWWCQIFAVRPLAWEIYNIYFLNPTMGHFGVTVLNLNQTYFIIRKLSDNSGACIILRLFTADPSRVIWRSFNAASMSSSAGAPPISGCGTLACKLTWSCKKEDIKTYQLHQRNSVCQFRIRRLVVKNIQDIHDDRRRKIILSNILFMLPCCFTTSLKAVEFSSRKIHTKH